MLFELAVKLIMMQHWQVIIYLIVMEYILITIWDVFNDIEFDIRIVCQTIEFLSSRSYCFPTTHVCDRSSLVWFNIIIL
jgi:hypothetical protein